MLKTAEKLEESRVFAGRGGGARNAALLSSLCCRDPHQPDVPAAIQKLFMSKWKERNKKGINPSFVSHLLYKKNVDGSLLSSRLIGTLDGILIPPPLHLCFISATELRCLFVWGFFFFLEREPSNPPQMPRLIGSHKKLSASGEAEEEPLVTAVNQISHQSKAARPYFISERRRKKLIKFFLLVYERRREGEEGGESVVSPSDDPSVHTKVDGDRPDLLPPVSHPRRSSFSTHSSLLHP